MAKKILVVDDEAGIREIIQFNLENAGFEVDCASSAEEALEKLGQEHCLILLDVMMSGMSGFHMAEVLRKERNNQIPIIFLISSAVTSVRGIFFFTAIAAAVPAASPVPTQIGITLKLE
jgi:CheY-like chemotaxis protein